MWIVNHIFKFSNKIIILFSNMYFCSIEDRNVWKCNHINYFIIRHDWKLKNNMNIVLALPSYLNGIIWITDLWLITGCVLDATLAPLLVKVNTIFPLGLTVLMWSISKRVHSPILPGSFLYIDAITVQMHPALKSALRLHSITEQME